MNRVAHIKKDPSSMIAWVFSIGAHLGIGVIAFFITWSVIRSEDEPPPLITASWHEQPVTESILPLALPPTPETPEIPELPETSPLLPLLSDSAMQRELIIDGISVLNQVATGSSLPTLARRDAANEVQFMGLDAQAAQRIVYVVDASGSMLLHLSSVLDELERSLRTLHPKQQFGILFFQQEKAIEVPPKRKLMHATAANISKAMQWITSSGKIIPTGSSNPIIALRTAIRLKPDVIYLLSENITGSGRYEVPPDEVLAALDRLNPVDPRNGRRKVQINCIQYLTHDPMRTMERIAEIHGGADGYTLIERGRVDQ